MNAREHDGIARSGAPLLEGTARVVGITGAVAWLEPEPSSGCGSCAAARSCGSATFALASGAGTFSRRMAARRFPVDTGADGPGLEVGDRVVVGVGEDALATAALTAYALPLAIMLGAGATAEFAGGSDVLTFGAMASGLLLGLAIARRLASRLATSGSTVPRFLRHAGPDFSRNPA
ncbi:SoxR reducing system RseC family protein [Aromatoleum buckelii]|uniref:Fis family transcriptional regulator n=1 Tax=Aromatoleum buckelii TaxID=200254 RepID=A0ABX1N441_9RHOO|nr:SoxR reducing system RseC family protein [Aromatoleum buckelii]MCK0510282.1 SoxR reducing system RseC family protein [Aromatoleum buckelii]